ncbi:hypothetical protein [Endozoicomonas sp. GU-1]|uniref:hypothetical protein n=2 Tax=Endozoicomonas sp. GU-1 TaxID=3009078 RepID=UPI0022B468F5|nr:hypothetical protein [Endozoicomonas sp. GU-1]WBA86652.1 hypothetical protein O3276_00975 [Endozoicomonas sp. GU-1]
MDTSRPSGSVNNEPYVYIKNTLAELEAIHQNHQLAELNISLELKHAGDAHQGAVWHRKVKVVQSNTSLLQRFLRLFTTEGRKQRRQHREAAALFRGQLWALLQTEKAPYSLKKQVIQAVENDVLPFLKESECKTIISSKDTILSNPKERKIIREAAGFLKKELAGLLSRLPQVTLEDSREVLKAYYQLIILSPELLPDEHKAHEAVSKLGKHFRNTRQAVGFTDLKDTIALSVLHDIREKLSLEEYQQLTKRIGNVFTYPYSPRQRALRNALNLIFNNGLGSSSVQGHPRELVSARDLALLKDSYQGLFFRYSRVHRLEENLLADGCAVAARISRLPSELRTLDLDRVTQDFQQYESLRRTLSAANQDQDQEFKALEARCKTHRALIAEGRAALLHVQLNQGRRWELNLLLEGIGKANIYGTDAEHNQQMFKKLLDLAQLRGPQVDLAQLDWIIAQNKKANRHPNVAIEGAGPTGLMLAFTQFQEGANVSVFEKRSTAYNRLQVVRLDPKWMDMLKFYLGEHYYDLFGENGQAGKGMVRTDGLGEKAGEIVTHRLEEALNDRLAELMARNYDHTSQRDDSKKNRLERLAAYEMTKVEAGEQGYTVQAKYHPGNDPSPFANGKKKPPVGYQKPEATVTRPVDLVICAGGKHSQLRNKYMRDRAVTSARSYGVCSWEGPKDQPLPNDRLDTFPDFRGMVVLDQQFQQFFQEQMISQVERIEGLSSDERRLLGQQTHGQSRGVRSLQSSIHGRVMKTRCFDNNNLVYIGMELPEAFTQFCHKVKQKLAALPVPDLDQNGDKRSAADQKAWRNQRVAKVQKALSKAWFQTVAHSYGIDQSLGVTEEMIDDPSVAVFYLQQRRVWRNVIKKKSGSRQVVITAAGDAAATPHFMTGSGLTGARENVLHLQNYTRDVWNGPRIYNEYGLEQRQDRLEDAQLDTADFVIRQGLNFLI